MINVHIYENNGLIALCEIESENKQEFDEDLSRIKSIPYIDREWRQISGDWKIKNAEKYADMVIEIGDAIKLHKKQLKLNI